MLRAKVESLQSMNDMLVSERDYLRQALENSQKLQAITASKIPALPAPGEHKGIIRQIQEWIHKPSKKEEQL